MKKLWAAGAATGLVLLAGAPAAMASPPPNHKVTYCHATGSETNPFVVITTDKLAVVRGHHFHQNEEDVIPPFNWALPNASGSFPGQNWGPGAADFIASGCVTPPVLPT